MRGSATMTTPLSVAVLINRPNPCFRRSDACGTMYSLNESPPRRSIASQCAAVTGSVGTRKGSFEMSRPRKASPREEVEAAVGRECRARDDRRRCALEQVLAQNRGEVEWHRRNGYHAVLAL